MECSINSSNSWMIVELLLTLLGVKEIENINFDELEI